LQIHGTFSAIGHEKGKERDHLSIEINRLRLVIGNWNPDCLGRIENDDRNSTMLIPMWRENLTVGAGF
jgi:hypothetical protein